MNSILTSVKQMIGIAREYENFDANLIMHINAAFSTLHQLGVGPEKGYRISGPDNVWIEFLPEGPLLDMVKDYVAQKVRMLFDAPSGSTVFNALNDSIKEFEWRIHLAAESSK